jgi:hypothetical protein
MKIRGYQHRIIAVTGCKSEEAPAIEEILRDVVFHSTLDWQTVKQFDAGVREAYRLYREGVRG